jgi:hypothetical protein
MVTPDEQRKWFKVHPAWSKSNKYKDLEARIYILRMYMGVDGQE